MAFREHVQILVVHEALLASLSGIRALLTNIDELTSRYGLRNLHADSEKLSDTNLHALTLQHQAVAIPGPERKPSPMKRIRWSIVDKSRFKDFTNELEYFITFLYHLLSPKERYSLIRGLHAVVLEGADDPSALRSIGAAARTFEASLGEAASVKALAVSLENHLHVGSESSNESTELQMQIPRGRLDILISLNDQVIGNMLAEFKLLDSSTIDILMEWRSIDTAWSANILDTMRRRFNNISQLLRDSHLQSKEYLILESVGFVEEPGSSAVGFLSRLPRAVTTESNVKSLHDLLNSPAGRPDLDWRIQLALELAVSLYQMHSTVWVHKNIRSRSVT